MSRQLPRTTTLAAGLAGLLALGALLGWGAIGGDDEEPAKSESASTSAPTEEPAEKPELPAADDLPELEEGFEAIAPGELLGRIAEAQRAAGSWEVSSVATSAGEESPPVLQQLMYTDSGANFRIQMAADDKEIEGGLVEGLYVDENFYLKGLNPKKWSQRWYQVPNDDRVLASFQSMLQGSTAASLTAFGEPAGYEVVGIEDATELDDDVVRTVHYRLQVDPSAAMGASGATEELLTLDIWVDAEDRPVQIESSIASGEDEYSSALYYSDYGKEFELSAPARSDVTKRRPPAMRVKE